MQTVLSSPNTWRHARSKIRNAAKGTHFFGISAPPIGSILFTGASAVAFLMSENPGEVVGVLPAGFAFALFSYVYGFVPAVATGVVAGVFRCMSRSAMYCIAMGIIGGVLAFGFGALTFERSFSWSDAKSVRALCVLCGAPGVFSGTLTSVLFRRP